MTTHDLLRPGLALAGLVLFTACSDDSAVGSGSASASATTEGATETDASGGTMVGNTCDNGMLDGDETDVDCGGSCENTCGSGQGCTVDEDCEDGTVCTDADVCGQDGAGNCEDGSRNGDETDVDCGGSCPDVCEDGENCAEPTDCQSGVCDAGNCAEPACDDEVQNGDETDVDCGGSCDPCDDGEGCSEGEDCVSGVCDDDECAEPTCDDDVHNGDETDVDCGGSCEAQCDVGDGCLENGDCESGACDERAELCVEPECDDGKLDGDETDIDCGGSCGPTCDTGDDCLIDGDCITDICDELSSTCIDPTCFDGEQNQDETDVDCGGVCGATCDAGEICNTGADCISFVCDPTDNTCAGATCDDNIENGDETDVDCGGSCPDCGDGEECTDNDDCISGVCDTDGINICLDTLEVSASPPCSNFDGAPVQLTTTATAGTGTYTYSWTPIAGLSDPTIPNPTAAPGGFETYTVTVDDGVNQISDSVTVVNTLPFSLQNNCTLYTSFLLPNSPEASITYSDGGAVACEADNNDFGFHLCEGVVFQEANLQGEISVTDSGGDNDWIGLVWNAQSNSQFYSMVWKQTAQNVMSFGCTAPAGIVVKRVDAPDLATIVGSDIYCPDNTPNSVLLNSPVSSTTAGWVSGETYSVSISFSEAGGGSQIDIVAQSDGSTVASFLVADTTYPSGMFGSTTLSQENACVGPLNATCQ